jgi:hypothetical protein
MMPVGESEDTSEVTPAFFAEAWVRVLLYGTERDTGDELNGAEAAWTLTDPRLRRIVARAAGASEDVAQELAGDRVVLDHQLWDALAPDAVALMRNLLPEGLVTMDGVATEVKLPRGGVIHLARFIETPLRQTIGFVDFDREIGFGITVAWGTTSGDEDCWRVTGIDRDEPMPDWYVRGQADEGLPPPRTSATPRPPLD